MSVHAGGGQRAALPPAGWAPRPRLGPDGQSVLFLDETTGHEQGAGDQGLMFGYATLALPYMYRAVDTGLRTIDVATLTEAAQSLGAGWTTILSRIILPNVLVAVLSGAFLTFAIVIGEFTMAALLNRPAFGPYMQLLGANRAYEPAALAVISFGITWGCLGLIQLVSRYQKGAPPKA